GTTNAIDERSLRDATAAAIESARFAPENPDFRGLPKPTSISPVSAFASATAEYTPERRAADVKRICDQAIAHDLNASGAWSTGALELAVANSHDVWAYTARTHASLKTVVMGENSSGYAERTAVDAGTVDVEAAGREAVEKTLKSRDPIHVDPGTYTVVLEPYA